jgi:hypothetical protein
MKNKPYVGQKVHLNDIGLDIIFGTTLGLSYLKTKELTITWVDSESMTEPEYTWIIEVDDPELNQYFLSQSMFD